MYTTCKMGLHRNLRSICRRFGVVPRGVVHVGAHVGQEHGQYARAGLVEQVWIEPQPDVYEQLVAALPKSPAVRAFRCACGDEPGIAQMRVLANAGGAASSLLDPSAYLQREFPNMPVTGTVPVEVRRLDDLLAEHGLDRGELSLLAMDVQGFELRVLRGAPRTLARTALVLCEVAKVELYNGGATIDTVDAELAGAGFERMLLRMEKHGWGDAIYVRRERVSALQRLRRRLIGPARR